MKNLFIFCLLVLHLSSCTIKFESPIKSIKTERNLTGTFENIEVSEAIDIIYTQNKNLNLEIETTKDNDKNILTEISDGILTIRRKHNNGFMPNINNGKVTIYLYSPKLKGIKLTGASSFKSTNLIKNDEINLDLSGASDATLIVNAIKVKTDLSGASDVNINGICKDIYIKCSGASEFNGYKLEHLNSTVYISGASDVKIASFNTINGAISGASSLFYKGEPKHINVSESGNSEIIHK